MLALMEGLTSWPQNYCCSLEFSRLSLDCSCWILEQSMLEFITFSTLYIICGREVSITLMTLSQPIRQLSVTSRSEAQLLTFWLGSQKQPSIQLMVSFCENSCWLQRYKRAVMSCNLVMMSFGSFLTLFLCLISPLAMMFSPRKEISGNLRQVVQASSLVCLLVSLRKFSSQLSMSYTKKGMCWSVNLILISANLLIRLITQRVMAVCFDIMIRDSSQIVPMNSYLVWMSGNRYLMNLRAYCLALQFLLSHNCHTRQGMKLKYVSMRILSLFQRGSSQKERGSALIDTSLGFYSYFNQFRSFFMEVLSIQRGPQGMMDWFIQRGYLRFQLVQRGRFSEDLFLFNSAGTTCQSQRWDDAFFGRLSGSGDLNCAILMGLCSRLESLLNEVASLSTIKKLFCEQNCSSFLNSSSFWNSTTSFFLAISNFMRWQRSQSYIDSASCFYRQRREMSSQSCLKVVRTFLKCAAFWQSQRAAAFCFYCQSFQQMGLNKGDGSSLSQSFTGDFLVQNVLALWLTQTDSVTSSSLLSSKLTPSNSLLVMISPKTIKSSMATWLKIFLQFLQFSCRTKRICVQANSKYSVFSSFSSKPDCELSLGYTSPSFLYFSCPPNLMNTSSILGILYWWKRMLSFLVRIGTQNWRVRACGKGASMADCQPSWPVVRLLAGKRGCQLETLLMRNLISLIQIYIGIIINVIMQKYLRRVERDAAKREEKGEGSVGRVRRALESKGEVGKDVVAAALIQDKVACIREILLFDRYDDFKAILKQYISQDELKDHQVLGTIFQHFPHDTKSLDNHSSNRSSRGTISWRNNALKFGSVILGLAFLILCYSKRSQLKQAVLRLLNKQTK